MERKNAADFPPEVIELYDGYIHGNMGRREFLDRASRYAVGGFTAMAMLEALGPNYALAQQVARDDQRIKAGYVEYDSPKGNGKVKAYLVRPASGGKAPGIVVLSENRGLTPYIEDVARRLATHGYVALAPDALTPVGGYASQGSEENALKAFAKLDAAKREEDLMAAYEALARRPEANGRVGVIGFCFGGGMANRMAARFPDLKAAVAFYGPQVPAAEAARIKAPLLLIYAGKDERINAGWPAFEQALKASNVRYQMRMYEDAQHAFHNEGGARYNEQAARDAWARTLDFFELHLKG